MKKIVTIIICVLFAIPVLTIALSAKSADPEINEKVDAYFSTEVTETEPHAKEDGTPYNICYVDIDPYPPSGEMLYFLLKQLYDKGWIVLPNNMAFTDLPFDSSDLDAKEFINYLADLGTGDYISFSKDQNYYIALEDNGYVKKNIEKGIKNKDIDLILCLGTSPGTLTIGDMGIKDVPIMVYFSVDPVSAGLSYEQEYSGRDNVWCHTSSDIYKNQLSFYHDTYPFKKIGMVYYSESVGAIAMYRYGAEALGDVKIVEKKIDTYDTAEEEEEYYDNLKKVYTDLVEKDGIDAFLLNTDMIKDPDRMDEYMKIFYDKKIPVFVQNSEFSVARGATMLMSASDAVSQAPFAVDAMIRIFGGEKPGEIYQRFVPSPSISINMGSAEKIDLDINDEVLRMTERFY
ncbi:MAG: hypothetical protein IIZ61_02275 [Lachnospiraceae bacterium]|nr:hypothetical protein [Lachnospiraceae bacterium]